MTNKQKELSNCTFVKTILMVVVVIYHCFVFWTGTWFTKNPVFESKVLSIVASWMNSFHIYAFTLVSGYLFYHLKYEKSKYSKFVPFVINKAKRLIIPYMFVASIWVIPFAIFNFHYDTTEIIKRYVFGTSPNQLWFLLMLFCVFLFSYFFSDLFRRSDIGGAIISAALYVIGIIGTKFLPNVFQILRACMYVPLFWIGFKMCQHGSECLRKIPALAWVLADVLLFTITHFLADLDGAAFVLVNYVLELALHIVGALMAFVVLQRLADMIKWEDNKYFGFLSKKSMPVYLFHQQIIYLFIIWFNGRVAPFLHVVINFTGAMTVSLIISSIMMRFKWTKMLIGEK